MLEGSIRRAGNQPRITASLVNASDGSTRWSQTFERELKDAFAVQNEIAFAVADQLSVTIGTRPPATLARLPDADRARYLEAIGRTNTYQRPQLLLAREIFSDLIATRNVGADAYQRLVSVLGHLRAERPELLAERFAAAAKAFSTVPDQHFPDLGAVAMACAFLAGNTDEGMRRLQAIDAISPFLWQDWVLSPSGRDLPMAKTLRADTRFAPIWAHRTEVIERERDKVRQFWPELD